MKVKTLEDYFRDAYLGKSTDNKIAIDHSIRVSIESNVVTFYIHPSGISGETLNFVVDGNTLKPDPKVTYHG
jgi:hypothetical protein